MLFRSVSQSRYTAENNFSIFLVCIKGIISFLWLKVFCQVLFWDCYLLLFVVYSLLRTCSMFVVIVLFSLNSGCITELS